MKFVALISGGKDSCFNVMHCLANGHQLVCLANLYPPPQGEEEIDSFMYQTVGFDALSKYAECVGVPMYREEIRGKSNNQKLEYKLTKDDETEDLYRLLEEVLAHHPDIEGVSVGAILSNYQRTRVEDVCSRLGLTSLAYLWERNQDQLMQEMCSSGMEAILIKVAAMGLDDKDLGKTLQQVYPKLYSLNSKWGVHICGEGGEFESLVLDAPFFKKRLVISESEVVRHTNDEVWYLHVKVEVAPKESSQNDFQAISFPPLLREGFQDIKDGLLEGGQFDTTKDRPAGKQSAGKQSAGKQSAGSPLSLSGLPAASISSSYISNLKSFKETTEEQIRDIFGQLQEALGRYGASFSQIQSADLFVADMADFAAVNAVYKTYFTEPLPPARCCVETTLPAPHMAVLSVRLLPDLKYKQGLHIQSRSYWAPSNIGPYSQTIANSLTRIEHLSGQIPLVPRSMDLETEPATAAVLSLQHLDNVKHVTKYHEDLVLTAFVTDCSWVPLVCAVREAYNGMSSTASFLVAQVTGLPKGAPVEWSGIAYRSDEYAEEEEGGRPSVEVQFADSAEELSYSSSHHYIIYGNLPATTPTSFQYVPAEAVYDGSGKEWGLALVTL